MDTNFEEAKIKETDVGVEICVNERFTEFMKYYRSTAETAAILEELGLPGLEVLRSQEKIELPSPKKNKREEDNDHVAQSPHKSPLKKEKRVRRRRNKPDQYVKQQNDKVDKDVPISDPCNNGITSSENNSKKVNKVHNLADSLQDERAEIVISDIMYNGNNNQKLKKQQDTAEKGNSDSQNGATNMVDIENNLKSLIVGDIPSNQKIKRYRGYPTYVYEDLDRCVIVEDWHVKTLNCHLTSLLNDELSKYGVVLKFGKPDKYASIEHWDMFYVPAYFSTKEGAAKALEAGAVEIESFSHSLTKPLPLTETSVIIRMDGKPDRRNMAELFKEYGRIRKIKHFYMSKKPTSVIVFSDAECVEQALSLNEELDITRYSERPAANSSSIVTNNIKKKLRRPRPRHRKPPASLDAETMFINEVYFNE